MSQVPILIHLAKVHNNNDKSMKLYVHNVLHIVYSYMACLTVCCHALHASIQDIKVFNSTAILRVGSKIYEFEWMRTLFGCIQHLNWKGIALNTGVLKN